MLNVAMYKIQMCRSTKFPINLVNISFNEIHAALTYFDPWAEFLYPQSHASRLGLLRST